MTQLARADAFFFITTIAVAVLSVCSVITLYYVIRILRDVREVTERVRRASIDLERDFEALRHEVRSEGVKVKTIFEVLFAFLRRQVTPRPTRRKKTTEENQA